MERNEILKLAKEERFEEILDVSTGEPVVKIRRRFTLMISRHDSDGELCAAINKAWTILQHETSQERLERMCRVGHTMAKTGAYDEAIQYLGKALMLPGDKNIAQKSLAAYLNARAVEKANKANEMLKNAQSRVRDNIIHGNWF